MAIIDLLDTVISPFAELGAAALGIYLPWRWRAPIADLARSLGVQSVSAFGMSATVAVSLDKVERTATEGLLMRPIGHRDGRDINEVALALGGTWWTSRLKASLGDECSLTTADSRR